MPRAPRYSKNERTLRLELARVARQLKDTQWKKDAVLERCVDQLTQDRDQQTRRAREAERAARRALELVLQAQAQATQAHAAQALAAQARATQAHAAQALAAQARAARISQTAAVCLGALALVQTVLMRLLL
jgi:hypothetical protein